MIYQELTDLYGRQYIQVEFAPNEFRSFPVDLENPEYIAFLKQLEKEAE